MSDTKMSGERAREVLRCVGTHEINGEPISVADVVEAGMIGAAALAERDELVEALAELLRDDPSDEWIDHSGLIEKWRRATDLLVKHGRIVMVDGAYKWSDRR
jgi:hypothetical protein